MENTFDSFVRYCTGCEVSLTGLQTQIASIFFKLGMGGGKSTLLALLVDFDKLTSQVEVSEKPPKVYCIKCKYYIPNLSINSIRFLPDCGAPQNKGTWLSETKPRDCPSVINENNDCKWFILKKNLEKIDKDSIDFKRVKLIITPKEEIEKIGIFLRFKNWIKNKCQT